MLRPLWSILKSPVRTFPALAAAIGCMVSGYSTFNGISEIFPEFLYSVLAAFGLAAIIQLGMVSATVAFREQVKLRPLLAFIITVTVLMSSFTSYVFYYRGFSEETIAKERQTERWESLRAYLVDARSQSAGVLGTLREAKAELERRIEIEEDSGGGLRNISNPYLQKLVAESNLTADLDFVAGGSGERYRFLSSVLPRVEQMESEMATALGVLDAEIEELTADSEVDHEALRLVYARASAQVPAERIREVRGEFTSLPVDPAILDTSALVEEEYWQRAMADLVVDKTPAAILFALISIFIDLMIVFFAYIAGDAQLAPMDPRHPVAHWIELAYGQRARDGVRRWIESVAGESFSRGRHVFHAVDVHLLDEPRDLQCERFLRQDGYLRSVAPEGGEPRWCLIDTGYWELVEIAKKDPELRGLTERGPGESLVL